MFQFLPAMMNGLLGSGALGSTAAGVNNAANAVSGAVGGASGEMPSIASIVNQGADAVSKIGQMPTVGGMSGQNGSAPQLGNMPMIQPDAANDPLMSKNSLLNGIGGPISQFFGMGGK